MKRRVSAIMIMSLLILTACGKKDIENSQKEIMSESTETETELATDTKFATQTEEMLMTEAEKVEETESEIIDETIKETENQVVTEVEEEKDTGNEETVNSQEQIVNPNTNSSENTEVSNQVADDGLPPLNQPKERAAAIAEKLELYVYEWYTTDNCLHKIKAYGEWGHYEGIYWRIYDAYGNYIGAEYHKEPPVETELPPISDAVARAKAIAEYHGLREYSVMVLENGELSWVRDNIWGDWYDENGKHTGAYGYGDLYGMGYGGNNLWE